MSNDYPDASVESRLALIDLQREQLRGYIRQRSRLHKMRNNDIPSKSKDIARRA